MSYWSKKIVKICCWIGVAMAQVGGVHAALQVTSSSFQQGQPIPAKHGYKNSNVSPQLSWSAGPAGTNSYAIVCDDPDAPRTDPWVHWVVFNIPASMTSMSVGVTASSGKFEQGQNDYGQVGWGGPNPPSGTHRYFFKVYALDSMLAELQGKNPTKAELLKVMQQHTILAQGSLMGTFAAA